MYANHNDVIIPALSHQPVDGQHCYSTANIAVTDGYQFCVLARWLVTWLLLLLLMHGKLMSRHNYVESGRFTAWTCVRSTLYRIINLMNICNKLIK